MDRKNFLHLFLITFFSSSFAVSAVKHHPAHQRDATPFTIVGGFAPNQAAISAEGASPGLSVNRYGTTTLMMGENFLPDPISKREIVIRDQHYPLYKWADKPLSQWVKDESARERYGYGIRVLPAVTGYHGLNEEGDAKEVVAPVATARNAAGQSVQVVGSEMIDKYLREVVYGYAPGAAAGGGGGRKERNRNEGGAASLADQPIFAQIAYVHPEGHKGEPFALAKMLKTEMGFTHKGLYLGEGKTVNSPPGYHGDSWWDSQEQQNYPAFITVMDFKGLVQGNAFNVKEFNKNGILTALILNELNKGAQFPRETDYKFDPLYSNSFETTMDFYARWLKRDRVFDPTLRRDDPDFAFAQVLKSYCAEHATEIINVLINLPQNLKGYKEVFEDGEELFELAMDRIYNNEQLRAGAPYQAAYIRDAYVGKKADVVAANGIETGLTPYWKLLEAELPEAERVKGPIMIKNPEGDRASQTKRKYVAANERYRKAGHSLGWAPETVADLLKDFVKAYMPWTRVRSLTSVAAVFGFAAEAKIRMAIKPKEYIQLINPIIQEMFLHEAAMEKGLGLIEAEARGQAPGQVEAALLQAFKDATKAKKKGLSKTMEQIAAGLKANPDLELTEEDVAGIVTDATTSFMSKIDEDSDWNAVSDLATASLNFEVPAGENKALAYRDSIYDREFSGKVKPMLRALNDVDANPSDSLTVKYYYAPAVHVRVALGIHDDEPLPNEPNRRDAVRLWSVGHVMRAEETEPAPGHNLAVINDRNAPISLPVLTL